MAPFVGAGTAALVCWYVFGVLSDEDNHSDEAAAAASNVVALRLPAAGEAGHVDD